MGQDPAHRLKEIDPSRTAVVLGSSFLGLYAHAGFLNGLDAAGIRPARLAGASAGALAGAMYAAGLRGGRLRDAALDVALRRSFSDVAALLRAPAALVGLGVSGIFSGRKTVAHLRRLLGNLDIADLEVPLDLAVTEVETSTTVVLRDGPLAETVMASCAVPLLFAIQRVSGNAYLDGGIAGELPFGHLVDDPDIDTLILHRIRHEVRSRRAESAATAVRAVRATVCNDIHRFRVDQARARGKRVVEMVTSTPFPGWLTHRRAPLCYERGFASGCGVG